VSIATYDLNWRQFGAPALKNESCPAQTSVFCN
jgi:hypothetical protein